MKNIKVFAVGVVAVMAFALVVPGFAGAQNSDRPVPNVATLQEQITALLAQFQQLQAQLVALRQSTQVSDSVSTPTISTESGGTSTTVADRFCYNWRKNLRVGDSGEDAKALNQALLKESMSGAVSFEGQPSTFISDDGLFIERTASAVVEFQEKYASEILTPSGLKRGTGYVGPATRAKLNQLYGCNQTRPVPPPPVPPTTYCPPDTAPSSGLPCVIRPTVDVYSQTITQPSTNTVWKMGTQQIIRWTNIFSQDPHIPKIIVLLSRPNGSEKINITDQKDGYFPYLGSYPIGSDFAGVKVNVPHLNVGDGNYGIFQIVLASADNTPNNLDDNKVLSERVQLTIEKSGIMEPSITVISPNGVGETWEVGKSYEFKWSSQGVDKVSVNLDNLDNGIRYAAVSNINASNGSAMFTVPSVNLPPGKYKAVVIEISYSATSQAQDSSDNYFTIAAPTTSTTRPLACGTAGAAGAFGDVNLDGVISPADADLIVNSLLGKAILTGAGLRNADTDGNQQVTSADISYIRQYLNKQINTFPACASATPAITLTSPRQGDIINITGKLGGGSLTFKWETKNWPNDKYLKFELVKSDGTVIPIVAAPMEPYIGSYTIGINTDISGTYRARVYAIKDGALNPGDEAWSGYFTIAILPTTPSITSISPTSGPDKTTVTVMGSGFKQAAQILFGGGHFYPTSVSSDGISLIFSIPPATWSAGTYNVQITNADGTQSSNVVQFTLTTLTSVPIPTVTSLSPVSGPAGTRVTVKGTGFSKTATNYIDFNNGAGGTNFSSGSIDGATLIFTAPNYTYGDYKVYVSNDENGFSTTYQTFTITAPSATTQTSLAVTNPIGGETLTLGSQYAIRWAATNMPATASFSVNLLDENGTVSKGRIAYGLGSSATSYTWTVGTVYADSDTNLTNPQTIPAGRYRVQVKSGVGVNNMSNSPFTITAPISTTQPSITVISPNGAGETWEVGKSYDFKWTSQNVDKISVNLDNLDNGIRYAAVSNITAANGVAVFTVPSVNLPPGRYKAFITEIYYTPTPGAQDVSDNYFTITVTGAAVSANQPPANRELANTLESLSSALESLSQLLR